MSEKDILDKLEEIETRIKHIEELEEQALKEEQKIESEEEKELSELDAATRKKQFDNIQEWQQYIWESCKYKKEVKGSEELDFYCDQRKGPCKFEGCPENWEE